MSYSPVRGGEPLDRHAGMLGGLPAGRMPLDTHTWDDLQQQFASFWRVLVLSKAPSMFLGLHGESSLKSRNKRSWATTSLLLLHNLSYDFGVRVKCCSSIRPGSKS